MKIFISYRRNDTQDLAGRIADRLRAVPQVKRVFIDVDGIEPGADFAAKIDAALDASEVCLLLIGPDWRGVIGPGEARISQEGDFVRQEVAAALSRHRRILPILANGASMPQAGELPESLGRLPAINALSVRHTYFDHDFAYLLDVLLARGHRRKPNAYFRQHPIQALVLRGALGVVSAALLLVALAAIHGSITGRSLEETLGGPGQVWLLIAGSILGGVLISLRVTAARN
jgi:TIR domain